MQIKALLTKITISLRDNGFQDPAKDARLILAHACNYSQEKLLLGDENSIDDEIYADVMDMVQQRLDNIPIAYTLGYKDFYDDRFQVNKSVLIPRNETELLVDTILKQYQAAQNLRILELGVGSGCIIISLFKKLQVAYAIGVDISNDALLVAKENAEKILGSSHQLELQQSDWFSNIAPQIFDVIVSNPPYIGKAEKDDMASETLMHEPGIALFSENKGLKDYELIASNARSYMQEGSKIFVEIGWKQSEVVTNIFQQHGYSNCIMHHDLAGIIRCLEFAY